MIQLLNFQILKFHFGEFTDIHFLNCTEHIDYYGNGKCGLGSGDTNGKQSEEHSLHLSREQEPVKHCEIDIHRVEHQLKRNQYRYHILTGDEPIDTTAEHYQAGNQIHHHCYLHISLPFYLLRAITTPPIIHANKSMLIASNGNR